MSTHSDNKLILLRFTFLTNILTAHKNKTLNSTLGLVDHNVASRSTTQPAHSVSSAQQRRTRPFFKKTLLTTQKGLPFQNAWRKS